MSHPSHEPCAGRFGLALVCFLSFAVVAAASPGAARAEDIKAVIDRVTDLNKRGLDAYTVGDFSKARQLLKQALDACNGAGLAKHAIAARTHIHMGVVMIGGLNQRELGVKQFQKALEIQPDIQVTRNVASPEMVSAYKEAVASLESGGTAGAAAGGDAAGGGGEGEEGGGGEDAGGGAPAAARPAGGTTGIIHTPVTKSRTGQPVLVTARLGSNVNGVTKVVLGWKGAGEDDFTTKDMTRSGNRYAAQIPASAARGRSVAYYLEAQDSEGTALAAAGGETKPLTVALGSGGGKKCPEPADGEESDCEEEGEGGEGGEAGPPLYLALMGGWGAGYTTGFADRTDSLKVTPGFAPSSVAHVAPEIGYYLKPDMRLSLQARIQLVGGPNVLTVDGKSKPAPGLGVAVLARSAWFFGEGSSLRPYVSVALGGGQIRHVVLFSKANKVCGSSMSASCIDTVTAGPVFAGGGGGVTYDLTHNLSLVLDVNALVGFTKFTFHLDVNGGIALRI